MSQGLDAREGEIFRKYLAANIESNRVAAANSPQSADWSNAVARGFELEIHQ